MFIFLCLYFFILYSLFSSFKRYSSFTRANPGIAIIIPIAPKSPPPPPAAGGLGKSPEWCRRTGVPGRPCPGSNPSPHDHTRE